ncbi:hypothetical protein CFP66_46000 [Pseudonocardia sp. MH-G8]|nr:hypothetical protein CFP66_46000 [Pseudonocardia sp. MH-G8]
MLARLAVVPIHRLTMIIGPVRGAFTSHDRRDRDIGCRGSLTLLPDGSGPQRGRCVDHEQMAVGRSSATTLRP